MRASYLCDFCGKHVENPYLVQILRVDKKPQNDCVFTATVDKHVCLKCSESLTKEINRRINVAKERWSGR